MDEIRDNIGRTKAFGNVDFNAIQEKLMGAVKKAVDYAKASSTGESETKITEAIKELGENLEENVAEIKNLVGEVKSASEELEKLRQSIKSKKPEAQDKQEPSRAVNDFLKAKRKAAAPTISSLGAVATAKISNSGKAANNLMATSPKIRGFVHGGDPFKGLDPRDRPPRGILAALSEGEFVLNAETVKRVGLGPIAALNEGKIKGFADGGLVRGFAGGGPSGKPNIPGKATGAVDMILDFVSKINPAQQAAVHITVVQPGAQVDAETAETGTRMAKILTNSFTKETKIGWAKWGTGISTMLMGGSADFLQGLFRGSVTDITDFRKEARILAFNLEGINNTTRKMQDSFTDMGRSAKETGQSIDRVNKLYLSNAKKGFKNQKDGVKVIKSGLYLSTMIGSEAEQTADTFASWHRSLGLSTEQIGSMADEMRNVALNSGVAGDELVGVMKSSEDILKSLRNQANLTSNTARNVVEVMANAKKLGVEEEASKILKAMSNTNELLFNAAPETRNFVFTMANKMEADGNEGAGQRALSGTLTKNRSDMSGMADQMVKMMASNLPQDVREKFKGIEDIANVETILLEAGYTQKQADDVKGNLNQQLKWTGMELGAYTRFAESLKEGSKSVSERIADYDKRMKNANATDEEIALEKQKKDRLILDTSMGLMTNLREELGKEGMTTAHAAEIAFKKLSSDQKSDMAAVATTLDGSTQRMLGIQGKDKTAIEALMKNDPTKAYEIAGQVGAQKLQEAAKAQNKPMRDFGKELKNARGDSKKTRGIYEEMQTASRELGVDMATNVDPTEKLAQTMIELNENIRKYFGGWTGALIDLIGGTGLFLIQLGITAAALGFIFGKNLASLTGMFRGLPSTLKNTFRTPLSRMTERLIAKSPGRNAQQATAAAADRLQELRAKGKIPKDNFITRFFETYQKQRMGVGTQQKNVFGSLKAAMAELTNSTAKLGDRMRKSVIGSLDAIQAGAPRFFSSIGNGLRKVAIETRKFYGGLWRGFWDARRAGQGFFRSIGSGIAKGYGSLFKAIGRSNSLTRPFTNAFVRGFARARKAGDGFTKAFTRGLSGAIKSSSKLTKYFTDLRKSFPMMDSFIKGFSRSARSGSGFVKSFSRGVSSSIKSSAYFRSLGQSIRSSLPMIDAFSKGFSRARAAGNGFISSFSRGFSGAMKSSNFLRNFASFGNFTRGVSSGFTGMARGIRATFSGGFFNGLRTIFSRGVGGALTAAKTGVNLGFKGIKAALLTGTGGTIQILFTVIDAIFGAVSGFQNTGKNFEDVMKGMGKSANDMTWGMYAASTISGALVGILDGLTFGLLRFTGIAEGLEKFLSWTLYAAFALIEGAASGIYGAFTMVGSAFAYLGKQFAGIGNAFLKIFNSIIGIFGGGEAKSLGEAFGKMLPYIKAIGRVLGFVVGVPIAAALWVVVKAISAVVMVIEILANAVAGTINVISSIIKGIFMVLSGNFSGAFSLIGKSIYDAFVGLFSPIVSFIGSLCTDIMAPFKWLYDVLYGHSIIPDLCYGIATVFATMAKNVLFGIGKLGMKIAGFFLKLPFRIMKGLFNAFVKWPIKQIGKFVKASTKVWQRLSPYVDDFFSLFKKNIYDYSLVAIKSWKGLLDYVSGGWFSKMIRGLKGFGSAILKWMDDAWNVIKNSKVGKWADEVIVQPLKALGSRVSSLANDWLIKPISSALEAIGKKFSENVLGPISRWLGNTKIGQKAGELLKPLTSWLERVKDVAKSVIPSGAAKTGVAAIKSANPFAAMGGSMGKAAAATAKAQAEALKTAAKAANPFATMSGGMGRAARATESGGKGLLGRMFGKLTEAGAGEGGKGFFSRMLGKISTIGATKAGTATAGAASTAAGAAGEAAKTVLSSADDIAKAAPKALGFLGKASGFVGVAAKKLPVVGPLIDFGVRKVMGESTGKAAVGAAGGLAGGLAGAAAGASTGTMIGGLLAPFTAGLSIPIGTAVGGFIGGVAGAIGGGKIADALYDNFGGAIKKIKKGLSAAGSWISKSAYSTFQGAWESLSNAAGYVGSSSKEFGAYVVKALDPTAWSSWFVKTGKYLYDGLISSLGKVWDWLKGLIPGGGAISAVGGAIQTAWGGVKSMFGYGQPAEANPKNVQAWGAAPPHGPTSGDSDKLLKTQIDQGKVIEKTMEMAQHPGSMYVHDIHLEELLKRSLKLAGQPIDVEGTITESTKKSDEYAALGNSLSKEIKEDGIRMSSALEAANKEHTRSAPATKANAWDPIKIPEKDPATMKAMNLMQEEIMRTGLRHPLAPSAKSSRNITGDFPIQTDKSLDFAGLQNKTAGIMDLATAQNSTAVGYHAVPALREDREGNVGSVQPRHIKDITETILAAKASSQAGSGKIQSDELTRIDEASSKQLDKLEQIREGIFTLVSLMKPQGNVVGGSDENKAGRNKDPRRPRHAAIFGKKKYGGPGDLANRALINNGEC